MNNFSKVNINYYYTIWDDKAFSQSYISSDSTTQYYYNIFGASARHTGLELDGVINLKSNLSLTGMFTYSLNKWTSDVDAYARPESNPNDEIKYHAFTNDLFVGKFNINHAFYRSKPCRNILHDTKASGRFCLVGQFQFGSKKPLQIKFTNNWPSTCWRRLIWSFQHLVLTTFAPFASHWLQLSNLACLPQISNFSASLAWGPT